MPAKEESIMKKSIANIKHPLRDIPLSVQKFSDQYAINFSSNFFRAEIVKCIRDADLGLFPFVLVFGYSDHTDEMSRDRTAHVFANSAKISKIQLQVLKKTEFYETFPDVLKQNEVDGEIVFTKTLRLAFWKWALHYVNPEIELRDIREPHADHLFHPIETPEPMENNGIITLMPGNAL